jgi:hypothetical protein
MRDRVKFAERLFGLGALYGREVTEAQAELYFRALADYSDEQVAAGIDRHVKSPERGRFWPLPADLILAIDGTIEDRARSALGVVCRLFRQVGRSPSIEFNDPAIAAAIVALGGWERAYFAHCADAAEFETRFVRFYRGAATDPATARDAPRVCVGLDHRVAKSLGRPDPEPIRIRVAEGGKAFAALPGKRAEG